MKLSVNQIAVKLGRVKSTIYDELQRVKPYNPDVAQAHAYGFGISTIYHWVGERIISDSLFPEHGRRRRRKSERRAFSYYAYY